MTRKRKNKAKKNEGSDLPLYDDVVSSESHEQKDSYLVTLMVSYPLCFILYFVCIYQIHSLSLSFYETVSMVINVLAITVVLDMIRMVIAKDTPLGFLRNRQGWNYVFGHRVPFIILALLLSTGQDLLPVMYISTFSIAVYYTLIVVSTFVLDKIRIINLNLNPKELSHKDYYFWQFCLIASGALIFAHSVYLWFISAIVFNF